ncbi:MAG TPA: hypothetical protein PLL94_10845 [Bacteroidales bacterium]|nr:hypothetical protein [Bacteroidales bacterium]HQK68632.1 hypothetical protein [Bacteroidales bacterium]
MKTNVIVTYTHINLLDAEIDHTIIGLMSSIGGKFTGAGVSFDTHPKVRDLSFDLEIEDKEPNTK